MAGADDGQDIAPVFAFGPLAGARPPVAGKDLVDDEHGRGAADAVALRGDVAQRLDGGGAQAGVEDVELGGVTPGTEVGVAAVGDDPLAGGEPGVRRGGQSSAVPLMNNSGRLVTQA